ncbi:MAG TPA: ATP-binding cassette domain-containing protein, partial [Synergistaceae bacterium]|nr:ATP-binding cassette domain-containing protein [Synergistaceae bacterium]
MTENRTPLLQVQNLSVNYGAIKALRGVSLDVYAGEIVCVIGANGAGKSTLMNGIMGMVPRASGQVVLDNAPLSAKSFQVVSQGVSLSPEGRKVFAPLSVYENLM